MLRNGKVRGKPDPENGYEENKSPADVHQEEDGVLPDTDTFLVHQVLLNGVILDTLFRVVNFATLKNCREVCQEWKTASGGAFRKRSRILINKARSDSESEVNFIKQLMTRNGPFTSLKLLDALDVKHLLKNIGNTISDLQLWNLSQPLETDISKIVPSHLKKIYVNANWASFKLLVSLDDMPPVDHLALRTCNVIIREGCRISPLELFLSNNVFTHNLKNNITKSDVVLNEFINMERLEKIHLHNHKAQNATLDLNGSYAFKFVKFSVNPLVINWTTSKWKINTLQLAATHFTEMAHNMAILELVASESNINLSGLPKTIQKLTLLKCEEITCSTPISLNNLTFLRVKSDRNLDFLAFFSCCEKLTELRIESCSMAKPLDINTIPKSVRKIYIDRDLDFIGTTDIIFDTIVLTGIEVHCLEKYFQMTAQNLIYLSNIGGCQLKKKPYLVNKLIHVSGEPFQNIFVGKLPLQESECSFLKTKLGRHVDKMSEYYKFTAGEGKAISGYEIRDMIYAPAVFYMENYEEDDAFTSIVHFRF